MDRSSVCRWEAALRKPSDRNMRYIERIWRRSLLAPGDDEAALYGELANDAVDR